MNLVFPYDISQPTINNINTILNQPLIIIYMILLF